MTIAVLKRDSRLVSYSTPQSQIAETENLRSAYVLSALVAMVAATVSVLGLLFPAVYHGNWGSGTSLGNDLITLVVAVPALALAVIYSIRGSVRARLIWLGTLYYMFYNYAFYVFGIPVTKLYLPIISAFAMSGLALMLALLNLNSEAMGSRFSARTPAKPIAMYLFVAAAMVSNLWISQWIKFLRTGHVPDVNGSELAYQVIAAVDLSFMVPLFVVASWLLWRRRPWGYVLGVITNVQGAIYNAVMATVCVFSWEMTGSKLVSDWFISCIVGITLCSTCVVVLLLSVKRLGQSQ